MTVIVDYSAFIYSCKTLANLPKSWQVMRYVFDVHCLCEAKHTVLICMNEINMKYLIVDFNFM